MHGFIEFLSNFASCITKILCFLADFILVSFHLFPLNIQLIPHHILLFVYFYELSLDLFHNFLHFFILVLFISELLHHLFISLLKIFQQIFFLLTLLYNIIDQQLCFDMIFIEFLTLLNHLQAFLMNCLVAIPQYCNLTYYCLYAESSLSIR